MDSRERLRRCYHNEQLDRPGIYIRDGYACNDPTYDRLKAYINAETELKSRWSPPWTHDEALFDYRTNPYNDDFERHVTTLHTPAGDLQSVYLASLKNQPGMIEEYFIKTREDAEKYLSLPMPKPECDVSGFFQTDREIGNCGIADVQLSWNPAGFVVELFGSELFAIMSITDRDVIDLLCRRQMEITIDRVKFLIENEVGPYFATLGQELLVPPLHGPDDFYQFNVKYDKPFIDVIHQSGGRVHVHSHGSIAKVFDGFIEMGADVLHPFEAPPMGDITAERAKDLARDKLCLEGNIQISALYEKTADEIRVETTELIERVFDDGKGFIVCPTASPYLFGKGDDAFDQFKAMIDTVLEWK